MKNPENCIKFSRLWHGICQNSSVVSKRFTTVDHIKSRQISSINSCVRDCALRSYFFINVSGFLFATSKVATVIATAARMAKCAKAVKPKIHMLPM